MFYQPIRIIGMYTARLNNILQSTVNKKYTYARDGFFDAKSNISFTRVDTVDKLPAKPASMAIKAEDHQM